MGGAAIFLVLTIVVLAALAGIVLYLSGAGLWKGKTDPQGDTVEGDEEQRERRPRHVETGRAANATSRESRDREQ